MKYFPIIIICFLFGCRRGNLISNNSFFEGIVTYKVSAFDNSGNKIDYDILGSEMKYTLKNGMYIIESSGYPVFKEVYNGGDSIVIFKNSVYLDQKPIKKGSDDIVLDVLKSTSKDTILGYPCEKIVVYSRGNEFEYYFNKNYSINHKLYAKHNYNNLNIITELSKSIALKTVDIYDNFRIELEAVEIQKTNIKEEVFDMKYEE